MIFAAMVLIGTAQAASVRQGLYLSVHEGRTGAADVLDGRFAAAERKAEAAIGFAARTNEWPSVLLELQNNLCVAQIMQGSIENSRKTCDSAVSQAERLKPTSWQTRYELRPIQATAFSNRGVLRALDSDVEGAKADFNAALRLRGEPNVANQNLEVMSRYGENQTLARVKVTSQEDR